MLENTLTLAVDTANTGSTTNYAFVRFDESSNGSVYNGPNHDLSGLRQTLTFKRTMPTRNGNYRGTLRSGVKFTQDYNIIGVDTSTTVTAPSIIECNTSFPKGMTAAQRIFERQKLIAFLNADNLADRLHGQLEV